ncbi:sugar efflux transporter [Actinoplanes sp. NBRC 103695]|uniref:sugar efflux transporter n=1 Tax=Actinoplanes sp. NBRC 103695 TaxID=3032202 RepID=UPI0025571D1F|nr:sugar efflux transporter [Actinoplanes sp. NBRC 103695]GLY99276.1 MFS transporter [Actinoplanes sp. NBRC 103695]
MPTLTRPALARMFVPLGLVFLAVGISVALVIPFLSLFLSTEVDAGPIQVTVMLVAGPLSGVVAGTLIGRLSDKRPIRRKLLIGAALFGLVGAGLLTVVRDYWAVFAIQVTILAVAGSLFPQSFAYAREVLERVMPGRSAMGITSLRTVFSIAWVAGPPLAAVLIEAGGFKLVYGAAAVLYGLAAALAAVSLPDVRPLDPSPDDVVPDDPVPVPGRAKLLLITVIFTALQCPLTLGVQALPLYISRNLGGEVSDAGLVLGLCALLEIPLLLGLGWLSTRVPVRAVIIGGAACGIVYFLIVFSAGEVWMLLAAQVMNALFIAAVSGPSISFVQDLLPAEPGRATTLFTNTFPIGAMLAGPLFGVAQRFDYRLAYVMCAALCAVGLVLLMVMRTNVRPRVS